MNTHVDNIQSSVSKNLNIIRRLKYRLSCTNLDKLYLVYIRPLFEYACELWDNCGIVVMGTDFPLKEKSRFSGMLRLEKIMISVLSGLNDILVSHFFLP
jgi:hypothetical protein